MENNINFADMVRANPMVKYCPKRKLQKSNLKKNLKKINELLMHNS